MSVTVRPYADGGWEVDIRVTLPDGTVLLEGTTWYQNRFWPAPYWHLWSDAIIDSIHNRVLLHIKTLAENAPQKGTNETN